VYRFVVDLSEARPLSEIEQALYGCDAVDLQRFFPRETWLTWVTFYPQIFGGTDEEWRITAHWWKTSRATKRLRLPCRIPSVIDSDLAGHASDKNQQRHGQIADTGTRDTFDDCTSGRSSVP
jgi:hypothetical protein